MHSFFFSSLIFSSIVSELQIKMKKKIALIAGGDSGEYPISIKSASMVSAEIDRSKYQVYLIKIKGQDWVYEDSVRGNISIDKNDFSLQIENEKVIFDLIFNLIHGSPGENGKLQGYFDMLDLSYTSSNAVTSALTFNKAYCNHIVRGAGVAVSKNVHLFKHHKCDLETLIQHISLPAFIKPNQGGSSVGMSKVNKVDELKPALDKAFAEDDEILVEEYIKGRELTCGVFDYNGEVMRFPITEIIPKRDFFDYEAKYSENMAEEVTPADLSIEDKTRIQETSAKLYRILNCRGIVRFDYILNKENLWFLEVNTVPGMSNASIIPQQIQAMGYSLSEFYTMIIEEALK
jgi:D-alanine-D-alanine ligase